MSESLFGLKEPGPCHACQEEITRAIVRQRLLFDGWASLEEGKAVLSEYRERKKSAQCPLIVRLRYGRNDVELDPTKLEILVRLESVH